MSFWNTWLEKWEELKKSYFPQELLEKPIFQETQSPVFPGQVWESLDRDESAWKVTIVEVLQEAVTYAFENGFQRTLPLQYFLRIYRKIS